MTLSDRQKRDVAAVLRLADSLAKAEAARWQSSPRPRSRDEVARSSSEPSDPTSSAALDERRLAVSEAAGRAEALLSRAAPLARRLARDLDEAVARWEGHAEET